MRLQHKFHVQDIRKMNLKGQLKFVSTIWTVINIKIVNVSSSVVFKLWQVAYKLFVFEITMYYY